MTIRTVNSNVLFDIETCGMLQRGSRDAFSKSRNGTHQLLSLSPLSSAVACACSAASAERERSPERLRGKFGMAHQAPSCNLISTQQYEVNNYQNEWVKQKIVASSRAMR